MLGNWGSRVWSSVFCFFSDCEVQSEGSLS